VNLQARYKILCLRGSDRRVYSLTSLRFSVQIAHAMAADTFIESQLERELIALRSLPRRRAAAALALAELLAPIVASGQATPLILLAFEAATLRALRRGFSSIN
jgi:hypothetical protein